MKNLYCQGLQQDGVSHLDEDFGLAEYFYMREIRTLGVFCMESYQHSCSFGPDVVFYLLEYGPEVLYGLRDPRIAVLYNGGCHPDIMLHIRTLRPDEVCDLPCTTFCKGL